MWDLEKNFKRQLPNQVHAVLGVGGVHASFTCASNDILWLQAGHLTVDWQYRYYNLNLPVQITPNRERIEDKWTDLQSIITPDEARAGRPSAVA